MKKTAMKALLAVALLVLPAAYCTAAQDADGPPASRERLQNVRERIETLRMWKLTKALDLDEKTSSQLFPVLNRYDRKRADLEIALRDSMRDLRETVRSGNETRIRPLLDRIEEAHEAVQRLNDGEWKELKQILTVAQQAKYIIFRQEFEREIRRMIEEARERREERREMRRDERGPAGRSAPGR